MSSAVGRFATWYKVNTRPTNALVTEKSHLDRTTSLVRGKLSETIPLIGLYHKRRVGDTRSTIDHSGSCLKLGKVHVGDALVSDHQPTSRCVKNGCLLLKKRYQFPPE
jgi:hypothetical protein